MTSGTLRPTTQLCAREPGFSRDELARLPCCDRAPAALAPETDCAAAFLICRAFAPDTSTGRWRAPSARASSGAGSAGWRATSRWCAEPWACVLASADALGHAAAAVIPLLFVATLLCRCARPASRTRRLAMAAFRSFSSATASRRRACRTQPSWKISPGAHTTPFLCTSCIVAGAAAHDPPSRRLVPDASGPARSHGFVCAACDHTFDCAVVRFPNGELEMFDAQTVSKLPYSELRNFRRKQARARILAPNRVGFPDTDSFPSIRRRQIEVRAADLSFVLDKLKVWDIEAGHVLAGRVDWQRAAAVGHSQGGATVGAVAQVRTRMRRRNNAPPSKRSRLLLLCYALIAGSRPCPAAGQAHSGCCAAGRLDVGPGREIHRPWGE